MRCLVEKHVNIVQLMPVLFLYNTFPISGPTEAAFFNVHKTWGNEADWIFSLSLSLAAILLCPHSLNPVCPSPAKPCSHYPLPSIFLPPNSLSLCSSEIRCSSLWAVVRCERRERVSPSSFNYLQGLQASEGNRTCMHLCMLVQGSFCLCVGVGDCGYVCVRACQCASAACF